MTDFAGQQQISRPGFKLPIVEHRQKIYPGFSAKYGAYRLVWMEDYDRIVDAIAREKMIKKWRRSWKVELIETMNPTWEDLFDQLNR